MTRRPSLGHFTRLCWEPQNPPGLKPDGMEEAVKEVGFGKKKLLKRYIKILEVWSHGSFIYLLI